MKNAHNKLLFYILLLMPILFYCTKPEEQQIKVEILQQEFQDNGQPSTARNFYFVFDGSGSMDDELNGQKKINGAKAAVREFIKSIPKDVNIGLYVFSNNYRDRHGNGIEIVPLGSNNLEQFVKAFESIDPNGNTPLGEGIVFAADQLWKQKAKQLGYGEYNIIAVTDGISNGDISIESAAIHALKRGIAIHAIGLGIGEGHPLNNKNYVVSYVAANDFSQLTKALKEAVAESEFSDVDFK